MDENGLSLEPDGRPRCGWHGGRADYIRYHDEEWGRPQDETRALYEKLCLEGFQAGLSWITILTKREAFRELFEGFEIERVAGFGEAEIDCAVRDARIVRHRGKIVSAVGNARAVRALEQATGGSFAAFIWSFEPDEAARPVHVTRDWIAANTVTPESTALSKALKRHGFTFVGATTMHAFMQAMGLVNDHVEGCVCRAPCEAERQAFVRPG